MKEASAFEYSWSTSPKLYFLLSQICKMGKRSRRNKNKLPRQSSISPNAQKDCIQDAQNAASRDKWMDNVLISLAGTDFFNVNPKTNTIDRYMYDRIHMLGECGNYKFNKTRWGSGRFPWQQVGHKGGHITTASTPRPRRNRAGQMRRNLCF